MTTIATLTLSAPSFPYGLTEFDVHDVLNIFQITGLDPDGCYFMEASSTTPDPYIEFFAEQDLLRAKRTSRGRFVGLEVGYGR